MLSSLEPAIAQLELLRPLLRRADPSLFEHLPTSSATFALEGTITMFAHNIREYRDITRLFDFFLARHPIIPLYFFAAVVLSRREELLEIEKDEEDILHVMLSKLPEPFDIEFHIARSVELYERLPEWLESGEIKPNAVMAMKGLDSVSRGFELHRQGEVSGQKIVYEIE